MTTNMDIIIQLVLSIILYTFILSIAVFLIFVGIYFLINFYKNKKYYEEEYTKKDDKYEE